MLDFMSYGEAMSKAQAILTLTIDTSEPVEIDAFVGAFTSLAEEYRRQVKAVYPDAKADARVFVKEVRHGSTVADLISEVVAVSAPMITQIDQIVMAEEFVRKWGSRISALVSGRLEGWNPTRSELGTFASAVEAVARDPNASSKLEAAVFEDGKRDVRAAFQFKTSEAKDARKTIDLVFKQLETPEHADHERVLMTFTRSDVGDVSIGKSSGERVIIEEISSKPLALMYASELAEGRIKHEIRESDGNVYKKGFVVDVNVRLHNGKPSVYAVTNVHEIIELPGDDE